MNNDFWFRPLVWTDYRLAVLFTVILPLVLLVWALIQNSTAIIKLLTIYWRVSSLLAITVYLTIAGFPISFLTGLAARVLIPISLWYWQDINDELNEEMGALKFAVSAWRWALTGYCVLGTLLGLLFLDCAFGSPVSDRCRVWFEPPLAFKGIFHAGTDPGTLGFWGIVGLVFYVACLVYFTTVKLGRRGRQALNP
ncbi:DUF3177 family protein [Leptolyngbya sp. FACHB-261]|uniref:DUF3177 family protein n=1 Tax=Leptolyngbya sp. FACHB-261 TaxID=2692806 RepID=UPI001681E5B6|nr:DUF3177 family protein [Leptolyngbya sp. FACHB-261]MBD2101178.1 DUF3177 family protein [Leptolyngbya sp. FACHB-261]